MSNFSRVLLACAAVTVAAIASPASALLVQPVVIDMQTSGARTNAAITITNDRNRPDTIEISVNKLTLPEKGAPVLTPVSGDNFLIFPPTVTIQPGHTQVVRIRWVGEPVLAQSQTYMFATSELPIPNAKGTGIQLLYSIQSLVTVTSPTLNPDVHVISAVRDSETHPAQEKGKPAVVVKGISVVFQNKGGAIDYVSHHRLRLSIGGTPGWSKTLEATDISKSAGLGLLGPNSKRELFFPLSDVPSQGAIQASLEEAPGR